MQYFVTPAHMCCSYIIIGNLMVIGNGGDPEEETEKMAAVVDEKVRKNRELLSLEENTFESKFAIMCKCATHPTTPP